MKAFPCTRPVPEPHRSVDSIFTISAISAITTFSTFSVEVVSMLQHGRWLLAAATAGLHVFGSLLLTWAGMRSAAAWYAGA